MKHAIILFSHGSLLCGAGENLRLLAQRMQTRGDADMVEVGYLNYSEPLFAEAFARCVQNGATSITVVPYFLVAGKFVKVDLPREIEKEKALFPHVRVLVADAMKNHTSLADAVLACAERMAPPAQWRDLLDTAPQFCRANPECPLFGDPKCPATSKVI